MDQLVLLHSMQINISMQCIMQFNVPHSCEMVEAIYIILMYRMFAFFTFALVITKYSKSAICEQASPTPAMQLQ